MATRVAVPLANIGRQMSTSVHYDVALPPFPLAYVVEYRNAARGLYDPPEAAAERASKFGQLASQAAVRERSVLRTVVTIDASEVDRVVARWGFREPGRGRRIVLTSRTGRQLILACLGRPQQSKAKFPIGSGRLLSLQSQWWNPAIERID